MPNEKYMHEQYLIHLLPDEFSGKAHIALMGLP